MDSLKRWNLLQLENEKGEKGMEKELQWFDRIKDLPKTEKQLYKEKKINDAEVTTIDKYLFFDTETYEFYENKDDPNELPLIIPYLIGTAFMKTTKPIIPRGIWIGDIEYQHFIGAEGLARFLEYVFDIETWQEKGCRRYLCAYNIDYDFHVIRPWIVKFLPQIGIKYQLCDTKKFLFGELIWTRYTNKGTVNKRSPKIKLVDLWRWDKSKSLSSYMKYILDLIYDENGEIRTISSNGEVKYDYTSGVLHEVITKLGFNKDSFKKLTIDYKKVNLHQRGNDLYYWRSKEDWIADKEPVKLDLEAELKYLEIDVKSLVAVKVEQELFRQNALHVLNITNPIDKCHAISVPGFAKYLCEEYEKKYMTETYRCQTTTGDYDHQTDSYFGAFVGGNKDITYLDEAVFSRLYPNKKFYDKEGKPIIKSYDVNSMYPWAMSLGLPIGRVRDIKPSKPHIVWYEIHFKSYLSQDPEDKKKGIAGRVYKWKPKYDCLNNCFFGNSFEAGLIAGSHTSNKVYVLKELWELFDSMCDHTGEIVAERYQVKSHALKPFVERLYEIKADREKKEPKTKKELIKLILNSLYGKMAERFKLHNIQWVGNIGEFICMNPHYLNILREQNIEVPKHLKELKKIPAKFKHKVSPFMDLETGFGFCVTENVTHRYNQLKIERRESITAGMFITSKSRWKLLSAVKGEIDQGNIILYCDTDSIKLIQFKKPKFKEDKYELGAWKNEGSFTHFGHPNRLKKYFMHNADIEYTKATEKACWMVKTSGVTTNYLRGENGLFDLEMIKTIYNPMNRVLIKNSKRCSVRNHWFQNVIKDVDFNFMFDDPNAKITHILENNRLRWKK